ncbi:kinase-like domain-containing protein [Tuber borchii]|uniref:Kinase-like domain-containing protein n=1 Tax=Tuber borchii TaxID=42251 RepID=A0A2T6ZR20_TUBBO|nr:kinase-like domain-containing protein [Tuber borchii]
MPIATNPPFPVPSRPQLSCTGPRYPVVGRNPTQALPARILNNISKVNNYKLPEPAAAYPPAPEPQAARSHYTPISEPPAWRLNHEIGTGACGSIFLENVHIPGMKSPELWAVKRISRTLPNFTFKRYEAEINNLQTLARHEWFVKFNSTYADTHYMYIAMGYMPMGDLSQSFAGGYRWNESDTKVVIKQLLHGLVVMHEEGITHRDLKPEGYMAPEVHDTSKPKTNKVDVWSLGIGFSVPCVSFFHDILQPILEDRPSAEDCLKKAWIINEVSGPEYTIRKDLYIRLSKINQRAPNVHSFPDMVANPEVHSSSALWQPLDAIMQLTREAGTIHWVFALFPIPLFIFLRVFKEFIMVMDKKYSSMSLRNP